MAGSSDSTEKKNTADRLRSPDDLELYIHVTSPSVWMTLIACVALLMGLLAWGVFGSVTTTVGATGAVVDGSAVCYLAADNAAKVHKGDEAVFGGITMKVDDIAEVPISRKEAHSELDSDFLAESLMPDDWAYRIDFAGNATDLTKDLPQEVSITVEDVAPLALILSK